MSGLGFFITALLVMSAVLIISGLKEKNINGIKHFMTLEAWKDIKTFIGLAIAIAVGLFLFSPKAEAYDWFAWTEIEVGGDYTKDRSPFCQQGDNDNRFTSHLNLTQNVVQTDTGNAGANVRYTHHSCAVNGDAQTYDAVGVSVFYRIDW